MSRYAQSAGVDPPLPSLGPRASRPLLKQKERAGGTPAVPGKGGGIDASRLSVSAHPGQVVIQWQNLPVDQSALPSAPQEDRVCRRMRALRGTAGKNLSEPADRFADIGLGNARVTEHHDAIVAAKAIAACGRALGKRIDPDAHALHQLLQSMGVRKVVRQMAGQMHAAVAAFEAHLAEKP